MLELVALEAEAAAFTVAAALCKEDILLGSLVRINWCKISLHGRLLWHGR